ncbi:hypothetical protein YC2023_092511 [Brassica napus]
MSQTKKMTDLVNRHRLKINRRRHGEETVEVSGDNPVLVSVEMELPARRRESVSQRAQHAVERLPVAVVAGVESDRDVGGRERLDVREV